jgi:uncharacterized protein
MTDDYRTQVISSIATVPAAQWNALLALRLGTQPRQPFLRHEFLLALEQHRCVGRNTGWLPRHVVIHDRAGVLVGAMPLYVKSHSYGEYVFDWAWADAYRRNGLEYYPKLLSAIPFTPIAGSRLLAGTPALRAALLRHALTLVKEAKVSSLHILFADDDDWQAIADAGMLRRTGAQFHWCNRAYETFEQFLAGLSQPKRKKIRAERRKVVDAGVSIERLAGARIQAQHWAFFDRCYQSTYVAHHSTPYLNEGFFKALGATLADNCVLVIASRNGAPIASSLLLVDDQRVYGRYWGALEFVPCLHFEMAYYQSIELAIERKLLIIEGGAQGEHKLARGFEPVQTSSAHWLSEPAFLDAVDRFLQRERDAVSGYIDELNEHSPYKAEPSNRTLPPAANRTGE